MFEINPNWVSAVAAFLAMLATAAAAMAAWFAYKFQKAIESNRQAQLKNDALIKNVQSLLVTFANIHATAKDGWCDDRSKKLSLLSSELHYTSTVISSLNESIGKKIEHWIIVKDSEDDNISRIVGYILGNVGAGVGSKYDNFFIEKSAELRGIQDQMYKEMKG